MTNNIVIHEDDFKVFDSMLNEQQKTKCGPIGFVKMTMTHEDGTQIYDEGFNLIVSQGREFIAQKISNCITTGNVIGSRTDWTNFSISHFGVGSKGSLLNSDQNITLISPNITDISLYGPIRLGSDNYLTENGGNNNVGYIVSPVNFAVKPITQNNGSVVLLPQEFPVFPNGQSSSTNYTRIKYTCILAGSESGEPNDLSSNGAQKIDEAGLYFTNGEVANLFAHICFAPKWKEKSSIFTIEWFILC